MVRLMKVGQIIPKKSCEIQCSKIGLGFEKLDREIFDPNKAYRFLGESGVKWARIQSGWQRTEREKGIYDFSWLDDIVYHIRGLGVEPWMCLCYGNPLYTEQAKVVYGAVGCPPIFSEAEKTAWTNYVRATVAHFKGRVHYYEIWNEPDGNWCWKHGANPVELGEFSIATARACKEADEDCEVIGFATCRDNQNGFLDKLCETGVCDELDGISYHSYRVTDDKIKESYTVYDQIRREYKPSLKLFQGESGTQSRSGGRGALHGGAWTPLKQAKYLLRHLLIDLASGVHLTSYFTCVDMVEALNGTVDRVDTYQDFGYFGVAGAKFGEDGRPTGEYTPKMSFRALQSLTSVFCNDYSRADLPVQSVILTSYPVLGEDYDFEETTHYGFSKPNGSYGLCYWVSKNVLSETYEGTVSLRVRKNDLPDKIQIADLLTGDIYELPKNMIEEEEEYIILKNLPITDSPLLLTFGDFII